METGYHLRREGDFVRLYHVTDTVKFRTITPHKSQEILNHAPDGFEMGYRGSGPAQAALAIAFDFLEREAYHERPTPAKLRVMARAESVHQAIKERFLAVERYSIEIEEEALRQFVTDTCITMPAYSRWAWDKEPNVRTEEEQMAFEPRLPPVDMEPDVDSDRERELRTRIAAERAAADKATGEDVRLPPGDR